MSADDFFGDDLDKASLALSLAGAATGPVGIVMLAVDVLMRTHNYMEAKRAARLAEEEERRWAAAEAREEKMRVIAEYKERQRQERLAIAKLRIDDPTAFLAEEDKKRNEQDRQLNDLLGRQALGSYRSTYQQNMIRNNMALQSSRRAAISRQSSQRLSGLVAQTDAQRLEAEEKAAAVRQQREEYMNAIETQRNVRRQQAQTVQDNLARSENILNAQQELIQQNNLANQRAQEQAAAAAASRPPQPTTTRSPIRTPRRLPPSVALPKY